MPTYLERYQNGECAEVWTDLIALGDRVREESLLTDAKAVADETMRRVRHNAEVLIPRLTEEGYQFTDRALEEKLWRVNRILSNIEAAQGARDWQRASKLEEKAKLEAELDRMRTRTPLENPCVFCPPDKDTVGQDEQSENYFGHIQQRVNGPLPLSLDAWYRKVGCISLVGSHPVLSPPGNAVADPLFIASLADFYTSLCYANPGDKKQVAVSADDHRKAGLPKSTPGLESPVQYKVTIPTAVADCKFENEWKATHFVEYLRRAFQWGGFPGWERDPNPPMKLIAKLTEGLLPL